MANNVLANLEPKRKSYEYFFTMYDQNNIIVKRPGKYSRYDIPFSIFGNEKINVADFINALRTNIMTSSNSEFQIVSRFEYNGSTILLDLVRFEKDTYVVNEVTINITNYSQDNSLDQELRKLLKEYEEKKDEIDRSLITRKIPFDTQTALAKKTYSILAYYLKTGIIKDINDPVEALRIINYIKVNGEEVVRNFKLYNTSLLYYLKSFGGISVCSISSGVVGFLAAITRDPMILLAAIPGAAWGLMNIYQLLGVFSEEEMEGKLSERKFKAGAKKLFKFVSEIEKVYALPDPRKEQKLLPVGEGLGDMFLEFIKRDIEYMKSHLEIDYVDMIPEFQEIANDYSEEKRKTLNSFNTLDMYVYLNTLVELEIRMYSRNTKIALRPNNLANIRETLITERLKLFGLSEADLAVDSALSVVYESVRKIMDKPYEGCEVELAKLMKLAQDYVSKKIANVKNGDIDNGILTELEGALIKADVAIEAEIVNKQGAASSYERLAGDVKQINEMIANFPGVDEQALKLS